MKYLVCLLLIPLSVDAYSGKQIYTAGGSGISFPTGWNNSDNLIEIVGCGGNGSTRVSSSQGGNGGGGGAYAASTNVNLGTGTFTINYATGGSQANCAVLDSGGVVKVSAAPGNNATAVNNGRGTGGTAAGSSGDVTRSGGDGGNSTVADAGGGGGGSAGPNGVGGNGAVGATINGGSADGGTVGQQTTQGATGNSGTEWSTAGCGGGGAGGVGGGSRAGGNGGAYGGGGGGSDSGTAAAGQGLNALVILQWNPAVAPNTGFLQMFSRKETTPCLDNLSSLLLWQLRQLLALSRSPLLPNRTR